MVSRRKYYEDTKMDKNLDDEIDNVIFPNNTTERVNVAPLTFKGQRKRLKGQKTRVENTPIIKLPIIDWAQDKVRECQVADQRLDPCSSIQMNIKRQDKLFYLVKHILYKMECCIIYWIQKCKMLRDISKK